MNNIGENLQPALMPVLFIPHGGGPMPLLDDPEHRDLTAFLRHVPQRLPRPEAILMISAHWEETVASISASQAPVMIYDYQGFPPETYQYQYPAPGDPELAHRVHQLLLKQNIEAQLDKDRGFDHGTFVPLMLMYPQADIPVVQLSLVHPLDPAAQIAMGKAVAPLREQGVLIIGSGLSFHNMRAFFAGQASALSRSETFDHWLTKILTSEELDKSAQQQALEHWQSAPEARFCHPREEHLLPLHVCFGAAQASATATRIYSGTLYNTRIAAYLWE